MVKRPVKKQVRAKRQRRARETDALFFLKLVVLLIVGSQWVFIEGLSWQLPVPVGLILGLVLVTHEHFQINRKIEYAILLVVGFVGFWAPIGLVLKV